MSTVIRSNDRSIVKTISRTLQDNGMSAGDILIRTIIEEYIALKKEVLSNGDIIEEIGLGETQASFRKVSKQFSEKQFTSRLSTTVDKEYKEYLNNKLCTDREYATKINGQEIYDRENN